MLIWPLFCISNAIVKLLLVSLTPSDHELIYFVSIAFSFSAFRAPSKFNSVQIWRLRHT